MLREQLNSIKRFCIRDDDRDSVRCLVCGICWPDDMIAINTRHLRILISKSKSSINGSFAKMNYTTVAAKDGEQDKLLESIPFLRNHYPELRQWTIRKTENLPSAAASDNDAEEANPEEQSLSSDPCDPFIWDLGPGVGMNSLIPDPTSIDSDPGELGIDFRMQMQDYIFTTQKCELDDNDIMWGTISSVDTNYFPCL